jgi:integrase
LLAEVFVRHYSQHAEKLQSYKRVRYSLELWLEFFGEAAVSDLHDIARQEAFHDWLRKKNLSPGSINRTLADGRSAINRAWKRGEVVSVPFVQTVEAKKNAPPMGRPLDVKEIAALIDAAPARLRDFIFWMVGTGARPDAILDLTWEQVNRRDGVVQLNPPGRPQTSKYRPSVRLPKNLLPLVSNVYRAGR